MPASLSVIPGFSNKPLKLTVLLLLFPLFLFAQSLSGLWVGSLHNDSATVRKDQSFEIVLTEYKDKVYGYSRSEFIVNDTLYYIVKRVKGTITGDVCEVTDDDIIAYNFRGRLDKGIKVTSTFRRNKNDSSWYLEGTWKTNVTKKYYAVTGKVGLEEEKDLYASKIFPHLEELKLANDVAFYKEFIEKKRQQDEPIIAKIVKPEKVRSEYNDRTIPVNNIALNPIKPELQRADAGPVAVTTISETETVKEEPQEELPSVQKLPNSLQKTNTKNIPVVPVDLNPSPVSKTIAEAKKTEPVISENKTPVVVSIKTPAENKIVVQEPVSKTITKQKADKINNPGNTNTVAENNKKIFTTNPASTTATTTAPVKKTEASSIAINLPVEEKKITKQEALVAPATPEIKRSEVDITAKAAVIAGRRSEFAQVVNFKSDSLELSLYDNGVIDGDTVSVYMNGQVLLSKQGLRSSAIKKTIYITPGSEDFTLVLYAENLGLYPPNTGLLVVHDGEDTYNLRFSSDFQKSSGIVFKKKK